MAKLIHQPHDKLFKQSMADIRVAHDFFAEHLPATLLKQIDLTTLTLQKETFINDSYKNTAADVVYSVKLGNTLAYLYCLCEHQSDIDPVMGLRLLSYILAILNYYHKQHPDSPLPIVYPLVIYSGTPIWQGPIDFFALFGEHKILAQDYLFGPYQLIDIQRLADDVIQRCDWSGIVIFALKYQFIRDLANFLDTLLPWLYKLKMQQGVDLARILLHYVVNNVSNSEEKLFIAKIEEYSTTSLKGEIMTLTQLWESRGVEKGMQQGMQQGEAKLLMRLLQQRFGESALHYENFIQRADTDTLLIWADRVLNAKTLEEVFS